MTALITERVSILKKFAHALLAVCCWAGLLVPRVWAEQQEGAVMEVKYYSRGNSPGLWPYQNALLLLALERTRKDYGDYVITYFSDVLSSSRAKTETERGRIINLHYSTGWEGNFVNRENIYIIEHPILKGLLGMRSLIVSKQNLVHFSEIKTLQQLVQLSAGQGKGWLDVGILKNSGFPVVQSEIFNSLAPMLVARRFDFLPLSVLEAQAAIDSFQMQADKLAISPDVALFYPLPINLCVSKTNPRLAERLDVGVSRLIEDGSLDNLFAAHFGFVEKALDNKHLKTFVISNPHLSEQRNRAFIEYFEKTHGRKLTLLTGHNKPELALSLQ